MEYYITKKVYGDFDEIIENIIELLAMHGFGIITRIDVDQTFKNKLDVDFRRYKILGACNPRFAHEALLAEDKIGVMLPCNVIIQEHENGSIEVSTINPANSVGMINNPGLKNFAEHIKNILTDVLNKL
jgi:uncharacterized protein (DUF302 family)